MLPFPFSLNPESFPVSRLAGMITGLALLCSSFEAQAQNEWAVSVKSGVNIPTEELGGTNLNTGFGTEGTISYEFTNFLAAYAGWGWNKFSADHSFAGDDVDFEETGYTFGVQFNYPTTVTRVTYMLSAGGVYNHLELENKAGNNIGDTGHELGTQFETGIMIMLGKHFRLTPYGRYRLLSNEIEMDQSVIPVNLKYLSFGLGMSWSMF